MSSMSFEWPFPSKDTVNAFHPSVVPNTRPTKEWASPMTWQATLKISTINVTALALVAAANLLLLHSKLIIRTKALLLIECC